MGSLNDHYDGLCEPQVSQIWGSAQKKEEFYALPLKDILKGYTKRR